MNADLVKIQENLPTILSQLDAHSDSVMLTELNSIMSATQQARQAALDNLKAQVDALEATHANYIPQSTPNYDTASLNAEISNLTAEINTLTRECNHIDAQLQQALQDAQKADAEEQDLVSSVPDETLLKLKLARGLGVSLIGDSFEKAHVTSGSKGDVAVCDLKAHSSFYVANMLWQLAE